MKKTTKERSGALTAAVVSLMLVCSGTSFSQNLGDAARQERERKQNLAHHSAHVYTNDDLKKPEILVPEDRERVLAARRKNLNTPADQTVDADAAAPADSNPAPTAPIVVSNIAAIAHASGPSPRVPVRTAHDRSPKQISKLSAVQAAPPPGAFLSPEIVEKNKHAVAVTPVAPAAAPLRENSGVVKAEKSKQIPAVVLAAPVAKESVVAKANVEHKTQVPAVAPVTSVANSSAVAKVQPSKHVPKVAAAPVAEQPVVAKTEHATKPVPVVAPVIPVTETSTVAKVRTSKPIPSVVPVAPVTQNAVVAKVEHKTTAPAAVPVAPVMPIVEHAAVAKVQVSNHVPTVLPATPVTQNAVVAKVERTTQVSVVAPVKPAVENAVVAKVQTSKHVPVVAPVAPVTPKAVVAKTEQEASVPAAAFVGPVMPAGEVSVAGKVEQSEHVVVAAQMTTVSEHVVPPADKTPAFTSLSAKQDVELGAADRVLIQKGDSLWKLAEEHLGNGARWPELAELNPEIADPNLVRIGEWVRVPGEKHEAAEHKVVVQPGDTLSKVAQDEFGNARAFTCIAEANPALRTADRIYPGETLILPPTCDVTR